MNSIAQTTTIDHKARTAAATVANVFAAKARHDNTFAAMVEKSKAENVEFNWDTGLLLLAA